MDAGVLERHHIDAVGGKISDVEHATRFIQSEVARLPADGHDPAKCPCANRRNQHRREPQAQSYRGYPESHPEQHGSKATCATHKTSTPRAIMDISRKFTLPM